MIAKSIGSQIKLLTRRLDFQIESGKLNLPTDKGDELFLFRVAVIHSDSQAR
jgi:hypothetical protein